MDVNDLRIGITLSSLVLFVLLVLHTWNRGRRAEHESAAQLPFSGDALTAPVTHDRARQERQP